MPRPTDEERAADVRAFYGLDEHVFDENFLDANGLDANGRKWVLSAPLLPVQKAPEGASDFEVRMRTWLPGLTKHGAGPLTAAALEEAGLPLKPLPNGKWKIDKDKAHKESDVIEDSLDQQNADFVRAFYGLDGINPPLVERGYLPVKTAPKGVSAFNQRMRWWLYDLTRDNRDGAGPRTAAALEEAGLPLKPGPNGKWKIDKDKAHKERDLVADAVDQQNAGFVRAFYGLDGKSPALADWGCLPSGVAPKGATAFHKTMLERLHNLTRSDRSAGKWEKEALEAAGLSVIENKKGGYSIDREATRAAYRNRIHSSQSDGFSQGGGRYLSPLPWVPRHIL